MLLGLITVLEMWLVVLKVMTPRRGWRKGKVRRRRRRKNKLGRSMESKRTSEGVRRHDIENVDEAGMQRDSQLSL